jgi:hypothetical protein
MDTSDDKVEPFLDWFGIWPGAVGYEPDGRAWLSDIPEGVRLSVQPAERSEPFLKPEMPWEMGGLSHFSIHRDGERYRMWYSANAPKDGAFMLYAESVDGIRWERPDLNLHEFRSSRKNNVVAPGHPGESVFIDLSAPAEERYKLLGSQAWFAVDGADIDPSLGMKRVRRGEETQIDGVVRGATSPDGLQWTMIDEPLLALFADSQNVAYYDQELGKYVGYFRVNMFREDAPVGWPPNPRRCVGRAETTDFRHWPRPRIVLQPDSQDPPTDDFYTSAYTRYPGNACHLMFSSVYHRDRDDLDIQLATSRDGINWTRPQRAPIIQLDAGEHAIYASPNLVPLAEDRWGIPYLAYKQPHNQEADEARDGRSDAYRWATWRRDRLVALEAPVKGRLTLLPSRCRGKEVVLNYQTESSGWIRAELIAPESLWPPRHSSPIPGFSFDDCEPVSGDSLGQAIRWNGGVDLSSLAGRQLCIRIEMVRAKLFSVSR